MVSTGYLVLLIVFVIIGLALGLGLLILVANWTQGAAFSNPILAIALAFGCCAAGVTPMYLLAVQIEKLMRGKERAQREKVREERAAQKKRRKRR